IIPVLSDITCSYSKGTAEAPAKILEASTQLDFYSPYLPNAWEVKVSMLPIDSEELQKNRAIGELATTLIDKQENAEVLTEEDNLLLLKINNHCEALNKKVEEQALGVLNTRKTPVLLGGDHNSPLGLLRALSKK